MKVNLEYEPNPKLDHLLNHVTTVLSNLSYKPGWELHVEGFNLLQYDPNWIHGGPISVHVHPSLDIVDVNTQRGTRLRGQRIHFMSDALEREIVQMIFASIRHTEIHEAEEWLTYNGVRIFDPHRTDSEREKLFELAMGEDVLPRDVINARASEEFRNLAQRKKQLSANPTEQEIARALNPDTQSKGWTLLGEPRDVRLGTAEGRHEGIVLRTTGSLGKLYSKKPKAKAKTNE